jgi:hypothetical protein
MPTQKRPNARRFIKFILGIVSAYYIISMDYKISKVSPGENADSPLPKWLSASVHAFVIVAVYGMQSQIVQLVRSARGSEFSQPSSAGSAWNSCECDLLARSPIPPLVRSLDGTETPGATESEKEMSGVTNFKETVTIATYARPNVSPAPAPVSFRRHAFQRSRQRAREKRLISRTPLKFNAQLTVKWTDRSATTLGNSQPSFPSVV